MHMPGFSSGVALRDVSGFERGSGASKVIRVPHNPKQQACHHTSLCV